MSAFTHAVRSLVVSLYPLSVAAFAGAVIVDVLYSRLLANASSLAERVALLHNVSDILLKLGLLVFLFGIAAIFAAWHDKRALALFVISLFVLFPLEFLIPVILAQQFRLAAVGPLFGPAIRILVNMLAAALAIIGFYRYARSRRVPA